MPISLKCACGAKLEFDDKFAGQTIPCPDCSRLLRAELPAPAPTRTSGLAVLSLVLALMGAFTIVGTLAAIACGAVAYRQLSRKRGPVGGLRMAQAGMILGGLFTVIAAAAYTSTWVIGIDSLARQYAWAGKLDFTGALTLNKKLRGGDSYFIDRPSLAWGVFKTVLSQKEGDHLLLVNPHEDSQILLLSERIHEEDKDGASHRRVALDAFRGSDFVRQIGHLPDNASETFRERGIDDEQREFFLDIPVGGIGRTFWFRILPQQGRQYINVLVCVARAHRFEWQKEEFRKVALREEK